MKYFMEESGEFVYPLQQFIDDGEDVILFEMKRDIGGVMFCNEEKYFVDDECGDNCAYYNPCNGVSGRCRSLQNGFIETGKKYTLNNGKITLLDKK